MSKITTPIGLMGLGLLGSAIGDRLLQHGFTVHGHDVDANREGNFAAAGGTVSANAAAVFAECEIIVLSLPRSEVVFQVLRDALDHLRPHHSVVDTTTGNPHQMMDIGRGLRDRNVSYIEANVAGSSEQMRAGAAVLFLGGPAEIVSDLASLWSALATKHFHLGDVGTASRFKLVHNLVLGLHRAVLAEGLAFAESLGFDPERVLEVLKQTPAASAVMQTKGKKMITRDWQPQAKLSQHLKDVRLILEFAEQFDVFTPLSQVHRGLLEHAEQLGFGDADNSAILEAFLNPPV